MSGSIRTDASAALRVLQCKVAAWSGWIVAGVAVKATISGSGVGSGPGSAVRRMTGSEMLSALERPKRKLKGASSLKNLVICS